MKKVNLLFGFAVILCVAAGCEKDDQNGGSLKIDAKVVNGNDYNSLIDEVRVYTKHVMLDMAQPTEIVSCNYNNGSFSLTLPKKVAESAYTVILDEEKVAQVNDVYAQFFAYKNNECVGEFAYISLDSMYVSRFIYSFLNDVAQIRYAAFDIGYEYKAKKGWSTFYFIRKSQYDYSLMLTTPESKLNWYFIPN